MRPLFHKAAQNSRLCSNGSAADFVRMHAGRILFACCVPESSEVLNSSTKYLLHSKPRNRTFVFASPNPSKPVSQQSFELIRARAITRILPVSLSSSVGFASLRAYGCCPWVFARNSPVVHNDIFVWSRPHYEIIDRHSGESTSSKHM